MSEDPRIDRRTLLKAGLFSGVAVLGAAACGANKSSSSSTVTSAPTSSSTTGGGTATTRGGTATTRPPSTSTSRPPTTPSSAPPVPTTEALDDAAWRQLQTALSGRLVRPGDPGYGTDVQLFDFRYDGTRPAAVAYCASPDDVARCVAFARQHGITPTPRGGGHSYGGYSTSSGLVVDVTPMNAVAPGPTAVIGAGARLIDIYNGLNASGVSIPGGSCPTVGIAGLALGGGLSVVGRLHGITSDTVASLQVVTADGRVVTASPSSNADLYWACRGGGGGNFGVVTQFSFTTFATAEVALFTLNWPWEAADQVLPAWQRWAPGAPDELWSNCLLEASGAGASPTLAVTGVYVGSANNAAPLLNQLATAAGNPSGRFLENTSFAHAMFVEAGCAQQSLAACHLPTQTSGGTLVRAPSLAKSDFLTTPLVDAGVNVVIEALDARQGAGQSGAVAYDACGGAISRPAADATAFVHRNAICSAQYSVPLAASDPEAFITRSQSWLNGFYAALRPYVSGQAYQNYIDPSLANWADAYYGSNLPRLEQVKAKWDPDDVFHFAQSIPRA